MGMGTSQERNVEFYSAGLRLKGVLYLPTHDKTTGHWPAVVLCNGFTSLKEMYLPDIARGLSAEGFAALSFDYRGFGESEGVSGRLMPDEQVQDVRNAVTFLLAQTEIRPDQIATYGTSFGGGIAIAAGAIDKRIRGVISSVPVCHGERWLRGMRSYWEWVQFLRVLETDRAQRVVGGISRRVDRAVIAPPDPAAQAAHAASPKRPALSLESADAIIEFNPEDLVDRLTPRPLLMMVAAEDMRVPAEVSLPTFHRAREPKTLVVLESAAHHDVYKCPLRDRVSATAVSWLKQYLCELSSR
jgi:alpha-beta hydrolase superfamily lysophospholipase